MIDLMNILIVGHPGSGKTYLADFLSKKIGTEKVDIDVLFDKHPVYAFSKRLYKQAINKVLGDKQTWIIDGYHIGLMPDEILAKADLVLYLNLPKQELRQNVRDRYKTKRAQKAFSHWQSLYINNLKNFGQIRFQDKALKKDVARIKELIHNKAKFVELHTREEIDYFLQNISGRG